MMTCNAARNAVDEAIALEDLPEDAQRHTDSCEACTAYLEEAQALALVTLRARRALEDLEDLTPATWVAVRAGIDADIDASVGRRWVPWVGLAVAAGAMLVVGGIWMGTSGSPAETPPMDARGLNAAVSLSEVSALAAVQSGPEVGVQLAAGPHGRTVGAFGRHEVRLAPDSAVDVVAWSPKGVRLALVRGSVTCDVNRASDEDVFEVISGDLTVEVLGTVFSVTRMAGDDTRVSVERGRVGVRSARGSIAQVAAGETRDFAPTITTASAPAPAEPAEIDDGHDSQPHAARPREPRKAVVVEVIDVGDQRMQPTPEPQAVDLGKFLRPVVATIRAGDCTSALKKLSAIERGLGDAGISTDLIYMKAWCHRSLGQTEKAARLFARYQALGGRGWRLPTGPDDTLPLPTVGQVH